MPAKKTPPVASHDRNPSRLSSQPFFQLAQAPPVPPKPHQAEATGYRPDLTQKHEPHSTSEAGDSHPKASHDA